MRRGGVTRVIKEQIEAIRDVHDVLVLSGERPQQPVSFPLTVIPSLAYDRDRVDRLGSVQSAREIIDAVYTHWGVRGDRPSSRPSCRLW